MVQNYVKLAVMASAALALAATPAPSTSFLPVDGHPPVGTGKYPAIMTQAPALPGYTFYVPADLATRAKLPVVLWGNGGCINYGNRYRIFLSEIASHGYLVVALGGPGPASIENGSEVGMPPPPKSMTAAPLTDYRQLSAAVDWIAAQNNAPGGALRGRIDTGAIAVMGHSCGGLQAIAAAAADPRIKTTLVMNSGVWNSGPGGLPGAPVTKASLARLRGSVLYLGGDASDGAHENSRDDFSRLTGVPAVWAYPDGVGHGGTYFDPAGGDYGRIVVQWLQWRLRGDRAAAATFRGRDCALCRDPRWHIARKNIG